MLFKLKSINENIKSDGIKYFFEFTSSSFTNISKIVLDLSSTELKEYNFQVGEYYELSLIKKD